MNRELFINTKIYVYHMNSEKKFKKYFFMIKYLFMFASE